MAHHCPAKVRFLLILEKLSVVVTHVLITGDLIVGIE